MATHLVAAAQRTFRELHGVVVSAGLMQKTVKVRVGGQEWNKRVQKVLNRRRELDLLLPRPLFRALTEQTLVLQ